jgi:hypothetical protein
MPRLTIQDGNGINKDSEHESWVQPIPQVDFQIVRQSWKFSKSGTSIMINGFPLNAKDHLRVDATNICAATRQMRRNKHD